MSEETEAQLIPRRPPKDKGKTERVEGGPAPTYPCLGRKESCGHRVPAYTHPFLWGGHYHPPTHTL